MPLPLKALAVVPPPAVTVDAADEIADEGPFVDDEEEEDEPPPPSRPLPIVPGPTRPLGTTRGGEFEAEFTDITSMVFVAPDA